MSKLKNCKSCDHEVASSAKVCPNCGKKLKMGLLLKLLILGGVVAIIAAIASPSSEEVAAANEAIKAQAPNTSLASDGELKDIFAMGSDNTDLQREEKEKEIKGEVVQWTLPVYEVDKLAEGKFKIQTASGKGHVATFCYINADADDEIAKISALKTGDMVTVKGKIEGIFMRSIKLDPCFLVSSD